MTMKTQSWRAAFCVILAAGVISAQVSTGTPPFSSLGGGPFDVVNLGNLNVHFAIPVLHKAGRGMPFAYDLVYESSIWTPVTSGSTSSWNPAFNWGWKGGLSGAAVSGYVSYFFEQLSPCYGITGGEIYNYQFSNFVYHDPWGLTHTLAGQITTASVSIPPNDTYGCPAYNYSISGTTTDGSGLQYSMSSTTQSPTRLTSGTITTRGGTVLSPPLGGAAGSANITDRNGNEITADGAGNFYDTLSGSTAVLTVTGSGTPSSPMKFTYTAPAGSAAYSINYTQYTVRTNFGVSGITEYGPLSNPMVSSIQLADGSEYQFSYEATLGSCTPLSGTSSCVTGRIASVKLPTGGIISYTYGGGSHGILSDGSTAGLTRMLSPATSCASTPPTGCWQYTRTLESGSGPGSTWQTSVIDPVGNSTIISLAEDGVTTSPTYNFYETQRQIYQGSVSSSNLLLTILKCYNANFTGCPSASVKSPITRMDAYNELPNGSTRLSETFYNSVGLVTSDRQYDYGVSTGADPGSTHLVRDTEITYASLGPATIKVWDYRSGSPVALAYTTYTYDGTAVTSTSGTPQHTSVSGPRGNLTNLQMQGATGGSGFLSKTFTYFDTGNPNVVTDANSAQATYVYGTTAQGNSTISCGNSFATTINEPLSLSRTITWNCTGGVATSVKDENQKTASAGYTTDPNWWRPDNSTDQMNSVTSITYTGGTAAEAALSFNNGASISDYLTSVDGFGRPAFSQRKQGPTATNYDTVEVDYNTLGQPDRVTMPYSAGASPSSQNTSVAATTTTYDALGRVLSTQDQNGGQISYMYTNNDVLQTVGGTSGTQTFKRQFEYDGLGRLTSVCEVSSTLPNVGACGQAVAQTGYLTLYTSDAVGRVLTVKQNAQPGGTPQTRTFAFDMLGRLTSESNPETGNNGVNGTVNYAYDAILCADGKNYSSAGDLVQRTDSTGNITCYSYDALHRILTAGNSKISGGTLRNFVYDAKSSYPSGVSIANGKTRLIEAQSTNASGSTVLTDEFFSYDAGGDLTDVYESTPHSGGYYHAQASYWPTGAINALSMFNSASTALIPPVYFGASDGSGLDGEGRVTEVTASSGSWPLKCCVSYSAGTSSAPLGAVTGVTYGSSDTDSFTYDPNTGRPATYTFSVNGVTDKGALTWNTNGTLAQLVTADSLSGTSDSETCTYTYDDLARLGGKNANGYSVDCGTKWQQYFTYDPFGNITKSGTGTFNPGYTFGNGAITNQFYSVPGMSVSYDKNGNLLKDNLLNTYAWDPSWGNPASINSTNLVYDALGRMVEQQNGSTYTQMLYSPAGKTAIMIGQTLQKAFINLPGGGSAIYTSSGSPAYYRHADWLGSSRLTSTASRTVYSTSAYAPFGEQYATSGTSDPSFTGQDADTTSGLYDFTFREHSPSQGRWISPDPLGLGAVNPSNPQTWNRYAYVVNNPLSAIDSSGLDCVYVNGDGTWYTEDGDCDNSGGGGGDNAYYFDGTVDPNSVFVDPNGNVVASVDGQFGCSGDSGCSIYTNVFSTTVNGDSPSQINTISSPWGGELYSPQALQKAASAPPPPLQIGKPHLPRSRAKALCSLAAQLGNNGYNSGGFHAPDPERRLFPSQGTTVWNNTQEVLPSGSRPPEETNPTGAASGEPFSGVALFGYFAEVGKTYTECMETYEGLVKSGSIGQ